MIRALFPLILSLGTGCFLIGDDDGGGPFRDKEDPVDDTGDVTGDDTEAPDWIWTPVLINFDELNAEIDVSTEYPEVTFSTGDDTRLYSWDYASYSLSPPFTAYTANSPGGAGVKSDLIFTFTDPVRSFQFYTLGDQTNGPYAKADVYVNGAVVATVDLVGDGGSSSAELQDFSGYGTIDKVHIWDMQDSYSVNIDDISFEQRGL